ncbi:MAG TPA: nucleoside kinase [Bacilli bacterium]|nr:nucleoside kinase [Bacilli bacterium]
MSFKITFEGKVKTFDKPVRVLDLLGSDHNFFCALVNNRVRELTHELTADSVIEPLTLTHSESVRIYQTSLRYLVAMAMNRIRPEIKIRFSYNVSRSIFIQILNEGIRADRELVHELEQEMKRLIAADIPFNRSKISVEEAAKIYEERGFEDKLEVLKYRPEKTVHMYECDGYLNYMYGFMVPSTAYLNQWILKPYSPGMILQYPRNECKGEIPEFKDAPTFGKTLKQSHAWSKKAGLESVTGINRYVEGGHEVDLINICEARHYQQLSELGSKIIEESDSLRLICIAGPSSSGKTTFANRLRIELMSRGLRPIRLSIDDYYLPRALAPVDEDGKPDLESIYALDIELFNQNMLDLINGEKVQLPKFDFNTGKRVPGRVLQVEEDQPIIIEGIHALNEQLTTLIPKHQKFKIYISPQAQINLDDQNPISLTDLRLLRRLVRDKKFRNASALETMSMWPSVRKGEFTWIYDTQEGADYVYNSVLSYELPVMRKYALPVLEEIDRESEYWPLAERLIRMLKYFVDLEEKWVPSNSLMREFIGGSCFQDV